MSDISCPAFLPIQLDTLARVADLIRSGKLHIPFTPFPLSMGLCAALSHAALSAGGGGGGAQRTKALLRLNQ